MTARLTPEQVEELERLEREWASAEKEREGCGVLGNYSERARIHSKANDARWAYENSLRNAAPALLAAAKEGARLREALEQIRDEWMQYGCGNEHSERAFDLARAALTPPAAEDKVPSGTQGARPSDDLRKPGTSEGAAPPRGTDPSSAAVALMTALEPFLRSYAALDDGDETAEPMETMALVWQKVKPLYRAARGGGKGGA